MFELLHKLKYKKFGLTILKKIDQRLLTLPVELNIATVWLLNLKIIKSKHFQILLLIYNFF